MPLLQERVNLNVEKILFATDFSAFSKTASSYAMGLAQRFGSRVDVAHVLDSPKIFGSEQAGLGLSLQERRDNSESLLENIRTDFTEAGLLVRSLLSEGDQAAKAVLKLAADEDADLIVVGTRSKQGLERMVLGSTSEEIIRSSVCPVFTVGPHVMAPPLGPLLFESIVFASDFSPEAAKAAAFALSFAEDSGAHLYFCHVIPSYPACQREAPSIDAMFSASLAKMIPDASFDWCSPECVLEHGEAAKGILSVAERVRADLIVIGSRKQTFLLSPPVDHGLTPDLLAEARCPVLTVC